MPKMMPNRTTKTTRSIPRALQFASGPPDERQGFSRHMFQQDVYTGILPYSLRLAGKEWLSLTAEEEERNKVSILCDSLGRGNSHSPENSVEGAVQEIALLLAHFGIALFEILKGSKDSPATLYAFNSSRAWSLPTVYLQVAPRTSWKYLERKYALVPKGDVWRVKLPRRLMSVRAYRTLLAQLSAWPDLGPDFLQAEVEKRRFPQDFSIADYNRQLRIHQYRATRKWGWVRRDWSLDYVTEYYQFYRTLTFRWAQALLREHIVSELNALLTRLNIKATISLKALTTSDEILDIRAKMERGETDFSGVNKALGLNT